MGEELLAERVRRDQAIHRVSDVAEAVEARRRFDRCEVNALSCAEPGDGIYGLFITVGPTFGPLQINLLAIVEAIIQAVRS